MNLLQEVQKMAVKKQVPVIKTGQTVRVHLRIKEGEKERIQIFEGLVIKLNSGHGADKSFTVRKMVGGIGVEKTFPLYSTKIEKIEVKKEAKVRRAKLYYMRDRSGKSARLKESFVSEQEMEAAIEELAEEKAKEEADSGAANEESETAKDQETKEAEDPKQEAKEEETSDAEAPVEEAPEETPAEAQADDEGKDA